MKTTIKGLKESLRKFYEDLDRERRAADYGDEDDPAGVSYGDRYEEDVDRLRRAADGYGETEFEEAASIDEDLEFEELAVEALTMSSYYDGEDSKKKVSEANLYSDADKKETGKEKKKAKGHVQTPTGFEGSSGRFPGPPTGAAFGENLDDVVEAIFDDGYDPASGHDPKTTTKPGTSPRTQVRELEEEAPPGREKQVKALKKKKGVDNPYAIAWSSYKGSKKK